MGACRHCSRLPLLPNNPLPTNPLPTNHLPTNHLPNNHLPTNCLSDNCLPNNLLLTPLPKNFPKPCQPPYPSSTSRHKRDATPEE